MGEGKHKKELVREQRLSDVAYYYCAGHTLYEVAEKVGVSHTQVVRDLEECRALWREKYGRDYQERLHEELAKIDRVEMAAWEGWRKSCEDEVVKIMRVEMAPKVAPKTKGGKPSLKKMPMVTIRKVEDEKRMFQCGDTRFLDQVAWCIETRLKVMGALDNKADRSENVKKTVFDWNSLYSKRDDGNDPIEARLEMEAKQITHVPVVIPHNNSNGTNGVNGNGHH